MLLIILGSLLILLVNYITKEYQTPSGLLIGNLALIDLLIGGFLLPFGIPAIIFEGWQSGSELCVLNAYTNQCLCSVGLLTLTGISLDRYVAIIHAIRYHQIMTLKRVGMIIVLVWAFGVISGIFPLLGWGRYIYQHGASLCVSDFKTNRSFTFFIFILVFGIPLNGIFFIYFQIYRTVKKQAQTMRRNSIHPINLNVYELPNNITNTLTNQMSNSLSNENELQSTNQMVNSLTNENDEVQSTNQMVNSLTNKNDELQSTNQMAQSLTNENDELQSINQMAQSFTNQNQLTNENVAYSCNKNEVELTNDMVVESSNQQRESQVTNENKERSINQITGEMTEDNAVYPTIQHTSTNQRASQPTSQEASLRGSLTNQNAPPFFSNTQHKVKSYRRNENKDLKPTKRTTLAKTRSFQIKMKKETKAAITMFVIVGLFVVSLTPFAVYNLYCLHTGESYETADFITSKVAYSNAIFNPVVYGLMNKLFRKGFYQVFYKIFRCKKRSLDYEKQSSTKIVSSKQSSHPLRSVPAKSPDSSV